MQLNNSTDYAVRVVYQLAYSRKSIPSKELSEKLCIPQSLIFKIGKKLSKHGYITVTTGIQGGYTLCKCPEEITMFDIVDLMEPTMKINRCLEENNDCSRSCTNECPIRKTYYILQKRIEDDLKQITISDLIKSNHKSEESEIYEREVIKENEKR